MALNRTDHPAEFISPEGAAEELVAAMEAACGDSFRAEWTDPVTAPQLLSFLETLLLTKRPDRGLDVLVRSGIMEQVLPEISDLVDFGEGIRHKDVWAHTKKVVRNVPPNRIVRFAALFHDIGKFPTRRFEPGGQVTFLGHPEVGARMLGKIARRLSFPDDLYDPIRFLVANHLRASSYDGNWTDSAVRRFAKDMGDALEDLLTLSRADITSKYEEKVRRGIELIDALARRVSEIKAQDTKPKPLPKGLGTAILDHFHLTPGPRLGRLMQNLIRQVENGTLDLQAPYEHYIEFIEKNPLLLKETGRNLK